MAGVIRNFWLTAVLLATFGLGAAAMVSSLWTLGLAVSLGLAGVVLLSGNRWRGGALLVGAIAASWALLDVVADWLLPQPMGGGVLRTVSPKDWLPPDPVLGYRPRPGSSVRVTETLGTQTLYRATYTIDATGARATPTGPTGADTYLFMGDSFMFGEGVADDETLPAQFARLKNFKVRSINLAVPGYGPTHLVRALESGQLDRFAGPSVKAVVTWIIPDHLSRATGNGLWLRTSPRYVLENGALRHTGSFIEHRWRNPVAGIGYFVGEHVPFIKAIGARQREEEQALLFVALIERLRVLANDRLGARLIVIDSWPERASPLLAGVRERLRQLPISLISTGSLTGRIDPAMTFIPHDGHPTAFTHELVAAELNRRLGDLDRAGN